MRAHVLLIKCFRMSCWAHRWEPHAERWSGRIGSCASPTTGQSYCVLHVTNNVSIIFAQEQSQIRLFDALCPLLKLYIRRPKFKQQSKSAGIRDPDQRPNMFCLGRKLKTFLSQNRVENLYQQMKFFRVTCYFR